MLPFSRICRSPYPQPNPRIQQGDRVVGPVTGGNYTRKRNYSSAVTPAAARIGHAQVLPERICHEPQHLVAGKMPVGVVESLEMIDIDKQDSERHTAALK